MEQDRPPERALKSKLVMLFNRAAWINVAYLARVTYENAGPMHVALCVRGQPGQSHVFGQRVGGIFGSLFGSHEHMDVIWITPEQEILLAKVCHPFYPQTKMFREKSALQSPRPRPGT